MHGGADATGQSAIANDATAPTHRRRNPGESLRGGPTLPEPAIPPVAAGHESASLLTVLRIPEVASLLPGIAASASRPRLTFSRIFSAVARCGCRSCRG